MIWLARPFSRLIDQGVARRNAQAAARRVMYERQQRAEVEAYLAGLDSYRESDRPHGT